MFPVALLVAILPVALVPVTVFARFDAEACHISFEEVTFIGVTMNVNEFSFAVSIIGLPAAVIVPTLSVGHSTTSLFETLVELSDILVAILQSLCA